MQEWTKWSVHGAGLDLIRTALAFVRAGSAARFTTTKVVGARVSSDRVSSSRTSWDFRSDDCSGRHQMKNFQFTRALGIWARNRARYSAAFIDTSRVALARVCFLITASIATPIVSRTGIAIDGAVTRATNLFQTCLVTWHHVSNSTFPIGFTIARTGRSGDTRITAAVFSVVATLDMDLRIASSRRHVDGTLGLIAGSGASPDQIVCTFAFGFWFVLAITSCLTKQAYKANLICFTSSFAWDWGLSFEKETLFQCRLRQSHDVFSPPCGLFPGKWRRAFRRL